MYGVGLNPIYLARMEERERKRVESGEAEQERKDRQSATLINTMYKTAAAALGDELTSGDFEVEIEIPERMAPGDEMCVSYGGSDFCVLVPSGCAAGDSVTVTISAPAYEAESEANDVLSDDDELPLNADPSLTTDSELIADTDSVLDALYGAGYALPSFDDDDELLG